MDIQATLTRKVGPLPVWGYGAVAIATVWAVYLWRQRQGASSGDSSVLDELGVGGGSFDLSGHLDDTGLPSTPGSGTGGETTIPVPKPKTNEEWVAAAVQYLADSYGYARDEIVSGLYKYLRSDDLTPSEWVMVTLARARFGSPPGGVAPTPLPTDPGKPDPKPPKPSAPPPGAPHIHHIKTTPSTALIQWHSGRGAVKYVVYQSGGITVATNVVGNQYTVSGLKPNTSYSFSVASLDANGRRSAMTSNVLSVRTKKG